MPISEQVIDQSPDAGLAPVSGQPSAVLKDGPLKILIVSWYFPPANEIGAVRVGKLAEYLAARGHEAHVLTAQREHTDTSLRSRFSEDQVIRTSWVDVDHLSSPWSWAKRPSTVSGTNSADVSSSAKNHPLRDKLAEHYASLVRLPDRQVGWLPYLLRAGTNFLRAQNVDLILASGPPFTTFVGASILARRFDIPWIAEYRDGWSRYLYSPKPEWREAIDERMENRITASASAVIAVSQPWADYYLKRFGKPTAAIYNGFDAEALAPKQPRKFEPESPVSIVYLGTLYPGLRDPTVLYEAVAKSGLTPGDIQIHYHGPTLPEVMPLADQLGVGDFIKVCERVSYARALEVQRESDVLLLLQSPHDLANVPAKTFEYFAARRPILGLGLDEGIPARLVRERSAGIYVTDPDQVAEQLRAWVTQKRSTGAIPDLGDAAQAGLSRIEQFEKLEIFAREVVGRQQAPAIVTRRPNSMLPVDKHAVIDFPASAKPRLLVVVDAEEEFDWNKPFSSSATSVTTMKLQHSAQLIFGRYGLVPSYAIDYPVAAKPDGYEPLLELLKDGVCEVGAQLHPWVTPPHTEEVCERNSYPGNLPKDLEYAKLKNLTEMIERNLGVRPKLYRAGRYGAGPNTAGILEDLGYQIDCSVLPEGPRSSPHAADYRGAPVRPYWLGRTRILEIPVTTSVLGLARRASPALTPLASTHLMNRLRVPGVMARLRLLDRIRLSPEGNTLAEAKRLTRFMASNGHKVFVISYHSPSLGIGHTQYVQSRADLDRFMGWLDGYLEFFFGEIGGVASTPAEVLRWAEESTRREGTPKIG